MNQAAALATTDTQPLTEAIREQLKIVIVGHVDHGKSTLIGRLFYDTDSLPEGKYEEIKATSDKRGMAFEWSFLLDSLQAERDQGITIDTTQIWFKSDKRDYVIIDAPGHKEFLKNMISGAANSEAALLLIDAHEGVKEQSKKHGYLLHLLGVKQLAVVVNKMDMVDYSEARFKEIEKEYRAYLKEIGVEPKLVIPVSAREGDNIGNRSDKMDWYKGPTVLEALDHFEKRPALTEMPLRMPVQDVYKFDERRIIVGRIESGTVKVGDEITFSPGHMKVKVNSVESFPEKDVTEASAGDSVGLTLSDQIFVERGNVLSHTKNMPKLTNMFRGRVFWLNPEPMKAGDRFTIKLGTASYQAEVSAIEQVLDTDNLSHAQSESVPKNAVAEIVFRLRGVAALDDFEQNPLTGRFVMLDGYNVVGGGIIDTEDFPDQRSKSKIKSTNITPTEFGITAKDRALANGHQGGVLWFSGLSGSGKSTIATRVQRRLFEKGYHIYVLDGDNVRSGLNADLGFSEKDRSENLRRVGEVAALMADSGVIVISALISPFKADRDRARVASQKHFHNIYIKADVETCEKRDVKGLYAKARKGEIKDFTGISSPFEEPENPDLIIDTASLDVEASVEAMVDYIEKHFVEPVKSLRASGITGGSI